MKTEGCYAAALDECSEKLTREHYISEAILRRLAGPSRKLRPENFPHAMPEALPPDAFTARVLCKKHNEQLSELDTEAGRLFDAIASLHEGSAAQVVIVSGEMIERWMLKVLCGVISSGNTRAPNSGTRVKGQPPSQWLRILFGRQQLPSDAGLFLSSPDGWVTSAEPRIDVTPLWVLPGAIVGLRTTMSGVDLTLGLAAPIDDAMPKPDFIRFTRAERITEVKFAWRHASDGIGALFTWESAPSRFGA
jgi:hypothetical protein